MESQAIREIFRIGKLCWETSFPTRGNKPINYVSGTLEMRLFDPPKSVLSLTKQFCLKFPMSS